jgi:hypothetical protein
MAIGLVKFQFIKMHTRLFGSHGPARSIQFELLESQICTCCQLLSQADDSCSEAMQALLYVYGAAPARVGQLASSYMLHVYYYVALALH